MLNATTIATATRAVRWVPSTLSASSLRIGTTSSATVYPVCNNRKIKNNFHVPTFMNYCSAARARVAAAAALPLVSWGTSLCCSRYRGEPTRSSLSCPVFYYVADAGLFFLFCFIHRSGWTVPEPWKGGKLKQCAIGFVAVSYITSFLVEFSPAPNGKLQFDAS